MSEAENQTSSSGLNFNDLLFICLRHKWKIAMCALVGLGGAAGLYFLLPPIYESEAKLLVRYVVDRSAVDKLDAPVNAGDSVLNSEVEILTSFDLASQVAEAIGLDKVKGARGAKISTAEAAHNLLLGLSVTALKGTNIMLVSYRNVDPVLSTRVLEELVRRYFDKHLEVHRSAGAFDLVSKETEQVGAKLARTEEELRHLKAQAGIDSITESRASLDVEITRTRADLDAANNDLSAQEARVIELQRLLTGKDSSPSDKIRLQASTETVHEYQSLVSRINFLRQTQTELLSRFTPENQMVKVKQGQINELEKQREELEKSYPDLVGAVPVGPTTIQTGRPDLVTEQSVLAGLKAKTETLRHRLEKLEEREKVLSELAPKIAELERKKEVEENNYKYLDASLEKARIDETLDPSRMPNISVIQRPSFAVKATRDVKKLVIGLAVGGIALGFGLAAVIELVLDQTVKRSRELETSLRIPVLLSIPFFRRSKLLRLPWPDAKGGQALQKSGGTEMAPWESGHFIRPFCEALRDRLSLHFQLHRMIHKPKLVAVTGLSRGAGSTTLAAGLAATLSQTCDGKVLLVDKRFDPKRFYDLISEFKSSDFDYVIFDTPSLADSSAPLAMAGFMDKVLLIIEAEKSTREIVRRAYSDLATATGNISAILNKRRSYGPPWFQLAG